MSCAPASFADEVLPHVITARTGRRRLADGTHFALGTMWGAAFWVMAAKGRRGPKAVGAVFGTVYTGDVVRNTALGLYEPGTWSGKDWAVDVVDELVRAVATGVALDRRADPTR